MAVTIQLTADATTAAATVRQFQASITQSLAGIDAKMQDTARKTGHATDTWRQSLTGLSQVVQRTTVEQGNLSRAFLQTGQAAQTQLNTFQKLATAIPRHGAGDETGVCDDGEFPHEPPWAGGCRRCELQRG